MPSTQFETDLQMAQTLIVHQRRELAELFGFETRNKYEILTEGERSIGFAAEQQKGALGFMARQVLGHWRAFDLAFFDAGRQPTMTAHHPFRWVLQRLEVRDPGGRLLGALQRRWAILSKRFDVEDAGGRVLMTVDSPLWKPWTFAFRRDGQPAAAIEKRWSGFLKEAFTDTDKLRIDFRPGPLDADERKLMLAAAVFIDLMFFEHKAG